ncbi:DUF4349 domain-containing protein [Microbacterium dextranolyticum]|uniref:DUF4349 domain-containing protein n=1 Tax=Microbacterium dextranolyticum TaxID=36806 RepID=A0A9W6M6R1_9MICO|nr:DUF4349 domain-containing protein [Microbacterium dextranolyticum]MBM7462743.1 hypothetical protein [Microbacterium dextranolyticum]GLJ96152.1 hypothetical protein GCM10017591_22150 [Microbacterium dextranolyticum]
MTAHDLTLPELSDQRVDEMERALMARIEEERRRTLADALADAERGRARAARRGRLWMGAASVAAVVAIAAIVGPQVVGSGGSAVSTAEQPASFGSSVTRGTSGVSTAPESGVNEGLSADSAVAAIGTGAGARTTADGRDIAATASATVRVADARAAADAVTASATSVGGYVESLSLSGGADASDAVPGGAGRDGLVISGSFPPPSGAWISVRVPSEKLSTTIDALAGIGEVTASQVDRRDVTTEAVDLRARVASLEASVARLTELMGQSASTADLIAAESALSQRQAELESLRQQLASLDGQVDMSSLTVNLVEKTAATTAPDPAGFGDGLAAGWNGLIATLNGLVIGIGFLLPWLVVAGIVVLAVWGIRRIARRRRARRAASTDDAD